jgi:glycosyltransferase involved in cell wall biosynthesis
MSNPLISIVIPSYNSAKFIDRLMDSLFSQTYKNWEAIIVDNNSIDDTIKLVEKYKDSRIKIYQISNEGIIAKSRNFGINKSKGEWIAFLDSDDWWKPNKLEISSKFFNKNTDLIYHKLLIAYDKNNISNKSLYSRNIIKNTFKQLLVHGNFIPNSSVLVRSSLLKQIGLISENINLVGAEDYNYLLKITKETNKIMFLSKNLGYYYMNFNGVSRKQMSICHKEAISEFISICTTKELKFIKGHLAYMDAKYLLSIKDYINSKYFLIQAITNGTLRIKTKAFITFLRSSIT